MLESDENDPVAHLNLGIYHFERNEYVKALHHFHRTQEMWAGAHRVDEWIKRAEVGKAER